MAQTDSEKFIKKMDTMIDQLDANMADIHKNTYSTTKELDNAANNIVQSIDDELSKFNHLDNDLNQISNVTQIYNRLIQKNGISKDGNSRNIEDQINFFNDSNMFSNVLDSYGENRMITQLDNEYNICCKYMPKLQMALDLKRDNVLSADNFKKEYINAVNRSSHSEDDEAIFSNRLKHIVKTYELEELFEDMVDEAYKYGEIFIYNVPYKKAFDELLSRKKTGTFKMETTTVLENGSISDSFTEANGFKEKYKAELEQISLGESGSGLRLVLHRTGIYESVIEEHSRMEQVIKHINESYGSSLYESYITEATNEKPKTKEVKFDKIIADDLSFDGLEANDGLINNSKTEKEAVKNIPGYVIRKLERANVIPIYIEDVCLGYYYLELNNSLVDEANQVVMNGSMQMQGQGRYNGRDKSAKQDMIIQNIASQLSDHINAHFINTNQDLRKEIYTILKYNDICNITKQKADLNVSFFPAEDVIHFAFKKDPKTHRGISSIYMVTDSTYMRLEQAYLLLNCQFTTANTSMYETQKGDISFNEVSVPMNCYPVSSVTVNEKAQEMLKYLMTTDSTDKYKLISDDFEYYGTSDKSIYLNKNSNVKNDLIEQRRGGDNDAGGWRNSDNYGTGKGE